MILLFFFLGFASAAWIIPVIDEIVSLININIEAKKVQKSIQIEEYTEVKAPVIGFCAPPEENEIEEDD